MQKIQFGLRQEHVVYLNPSGGTVVAAGTAEELADGELLVEVVGFGLGLASSSGSESMRMTPEIPKMILLLR